MAELEEQIAASLAVSQRLHVIVLVHVSGNHYGYLRYGGEAVVSVHTLKDHIDWVLNSSEDEDSVTSWYMEQPKTDIAPSTTTVTTPTVQPEQAAPEQQDTVQTEAPTLDQAQAASLEQEPCDSEVAEPSSEGGD